MIENIAEAFVEIAEKYPERTCVIEARSGRSVTFSELHRRSTGYAYYFRGQGINPGDRLMLMVTPSIDFICLALACFKSGITVILIDPGMGYKNLLRCIKGVKPEVLVGIPKALLFTKLFPGSFTSLKKKYCCGHSFGVFGPDLRKSAEFKKNNFPLFAPEAEDLAAIIFTTGSTGPPKGVQYEHSIFSAQLRFIKNYYNIEPEDIDQPAFPLFALFATALGACAIIPDMDATKPAKVDARKFINSIEKYGVTYSFGSPAIWNVVSNYCIKNSIVLNSVRKVLMAGAPVPYELLKRVQKILPPDGLIYTPYGATESLPIVSIESREVIADTWKKTSVGGGTCVGRALPGIEIKIIMITDDPIHVLDEKMYLGPNVIGEIIVKGDVVTRGYINNPAETERAKIVDDTGYWHRMGDVGYLDDVGRLWFCGRSAHRVETCENTLYTIPTEAIINEHPKVYRSALVGIPVDKKQGGKVPVIIIEPYPEKRIDKTQLLDEVRELGALSPLTSKIQHYLIHKSFPVDIRHNAKIFREKLALWAQDQI